MLLLLLLLGPSPAISSPPPPRLSTRYKSQQTCQHPSLSLSLLNSSSSHGTSSNLIQFASLGHLCCCGCSSFCARRNPRFGSRIRAVACHLAGHWISSLFGCARSCHPMLFIVGHAPSLLLRQLNSVTNLRILSSFSDAFCPLKNVIYVYIYYLHLSFLCCIPVYTQKELQRSIRIYTCTLHI
ncbi:hypothetical protein BT93_G2450 [Corymbia citriodora subsp. variegata]|nr:hypothetical protein BT93_G2450 [Corymbia citriodora subsp. variegata]